MTSIDLNAPDVVYAGFWKRLCAGLLDWLIWLPLVFPMFFFFDKHRLSQVYLLVPSLLLRLWYTVYLVQKYGGTPGKLLMKIRIQKTDGSPVGARAAFLRNSVDLALHLLAMAALIGALLRITDAEFLLLERATIASISVPKYDSILPAWNSYVGTLGTIWIWSEFLVMLTNPRRRALHDFIAGTVVVVKR